MSDLSYPHCKKCQQPEYACDCEHPDYVEPALSFLLRGEEIPKTHPFRKNRE